MDTMTPPERSARMALVRGKDTKPELFVRQLAHRMGYRFRLHRRALPGAPDLVFVARRKVIFVHGCFWHRHPRCGRTPKSRLDFWVTKLDANRRRDLRNQRQLRALGWKFLVLWECQLRRVGEVEQRVKRFLDGEG